MDSGPLVDYGIQTEQSDIRCHVAPGSRRIFVFQTRAALTLVESGRYPVLTATQPGINGVTARGYVVPWGEIPGIRQIRWESIRWWEWFGPHQYALTTSEKGRVAVEVVQHLLRDGRFPLWCRDEDVQDVMGQQVQTEGTDVLVVGQWRIQVKCDWSAGPGGTGNLFLQIAEANPLKAF